MQRNEMWIAINVEDGSVISTYYGPEPEFSQDEGLAQVTWAAILEAMDHEVNTPAFQAALNAIKEFD